MLLLQRPYSHGAWSLPAAVSADWLAEHALLKLGRQTRGASMAWVGACKANKPEQAPIPSFATLHSGKLSSCSGQSLTLQFDRPHAAASPSTCHLSACPYVWAWALPADVQVPTRRFQR